MGFPANVTIDGVQASVQGKTLEAPLEVLSGAHTEAPWCTCPPDTRQVVSFASHMENLDHGWKCKACGNVVSVG